MVRATQITIGRYLVVVAIAAYLSAFRELAVLLGIFLVALLFVAPVPVIMYFVCRRWLGNHRPANPGG
jgi:hypothetical protein